MTDSSSASAPLPGLGDLLVLLGGSNPFSGIGKAISQFQRGVGDFLNAVENFNETMEQMNEITRRVNRLLDDIEPPIRALMPQVTRTLQNADAMVAQMNALPKDIGEVMALLADMARRLQPLGQFAESAGGLLGFRQFGNLLPGGRGTPAESEPAPPTTRGRSLLARTLDPSPPPSPSPRPAAKPATKRAPAKKTAAKKAATKSTAAATRKTAAKKAPAKRAPAKKASSRSR